MNNQNEHLWDGDGNDAGEAFERKCIEWEKRDWMAWLADNLVFPFNVTREEDMDDACFGEEDDALFSLGHSMKVVSIEEDDEEMGIIVKAKEDQHIGEVPLCDLEVKPKTDKNYWPVREYVVWYANR